MNERWDRASIAKTRRKRRIKGGYVDQPKTKVRLIALVPAFPVDAVCGVLEELQA